MQTKQRVLSLSKLGLSPAVALLVALCGGVAALAAEPPRVLFLSKSSGFEHSVIKWPEGSPPSHVDTVLGRLAKAHGFELETTKDASLVNRKDLARFDVVVFFTTGDLTKSGGGGTPFGGDGMPAMPADGSSALLDWIAAGGGFLGYHSATDTFHDESGAPSPYIEMLGGEFLAHGRQFTGTVEVVDPDHPTMTSVPRTWTMLDEWYVFKNENRDDLHVLALFDPGTQRQEQAKIYDRPDYPVIWCRTLGEGRIYYNAMGHREDVWDDGTFQKSVVDALRWVAGEGKAAAEPNWTEVVAPLSRP